MSKVCVSHVVSMFLGHQLYKKKPVWLQQPSSLNSVMLLVKINWDPFYGLKSLAFIYEFNFTN